VTCVDGGADNLGEVKRRLPEVAAYLVRVDADPLTRLGRFDVVCCYGLLHHLEDPVAGLRNMSSVCDDLLLLETVVTDHELPVVRLADEPGSTVNQAMGGLGCRPTPGFVAMALTRAGFDFVYAPANPPAHPDFQFKWLNDLEWTRNNRLLRCIFVASRRKIENPKLRLILQAPSGRKNPSYFLRPAASTVSRIWLDVGAHLGEKSFAAAEQDPALRVFAFEPNLRLGAQRMGQLANYVALPMAVAEHDGSGELHINVCDAASSLLPLVPEGLDQWIGNEQLRVEQTINVPTIRLDTFLDQAGIHHVDFLKIDARGADLAVVRSCGRRLRDIDRIELAVQVTPTPLYRNAGSKNEVVRYLEDAGFDLEASELQSHGQEEHLVFLKSFDGDLSALLAEARDLSFLAPLRPRPGWDFGTDWDNPDPLFRRRRRIWNYCNRRGLDLPIEFTWHFGLTPTLYLGNDVSRALFIGGAIDPNEFAFLERFLRPGMVMVDAGANEGLYTMFAARRVGSDGMVLAFEPSARELKRLELNIDRNSLRNVTVHPVALGHAEGAATLRIATSDHAGQNTLGEFAYPGIGLLHEESAPVRTLDAVLAETCVPRLDLLKMDVEGSETLLIQGAADAIRQYRPVLLLEVSDEALRNQSSSSEELLRLVQSFGYLLYLFDSVTGLPKLARPGEYSVNMIAVPAEKPLPLDWCAAGSEGGTNSLKLEPLSGQQALFDIREFKVHNNSEVSGNGPISVATQPQQWSYAVGFPIREKARSMIAPPTEVLVRIEAIVERGKIGFGLVNADLSSYLTPERQYEACGDTVVCELAISYFPAHSTLIVRNTAEGRVISKAVIRSIKTFLVSRQLAKEVTREL
jgi:FkbM family methyltransferase